MTTMTTDALVRFCWDVPDATAGLTVGVIREAAAWDALGPEWDRLFAISPTASPPLRFEWLRAWWRAYGAAYGDGGRGLRVVTVRRGGRLIGALPLYERATGRGPLTVRRLGFVSTGEAEFEETCPEYLDLLHEPGEERTCLDAIAWALTGRAVNWNELELRDVASGSPLTRLGRSLGGRWRTTVVPGGACPIADISGGLEAYLGRLSANSRQHSRRLLRAARAAGARLEVASMPAEVDEYFGQLVELHQARWTASGQPGCFASERFRAFHHGLARAWVPAGQAVLARLVVGGAPVAVIYGFLAQGKFDFYQSGVRTDASADGVRSPGIVAFLMLMAHLSERGVDRFDFLRARGGDATYKHRLATHSCELCSLVATRPGLGQWARRGIGLIGRGVRRMRPRPTGTVKVKFERRRFWSKTDLAAGLFATTGVGAMLRSAGAWRGMMALAYHRIGDGTGSTFDRALWSATAEEFDAQVRTLKRCADVVGPDDLPAPAQRRRGRYVLITFDDGYRDNYDIAFPILKAHGVTAMFFVSTGFLDRGRLSWWDEVAWMVRSSPRQQLPASAWLPTAVAFDRPHRERAVQTLLGVYKALPDERTDAYLEFLAQATGSGRYGGDAAEQIWMTWDMVRAMERQGMRIGGHTVTHPVLSRVGPQRQRDEIAGCALRLREELGQPMRWFSYPMGKVGSYDAVSRACLAEQGVEMAFSAYGGVNRFDRWDPYDLRRTGVEMNRSAGWLKLALTLPEVFA